MPRTPMSGGSSAATRQLRSLAVQLVPRSLVALTAGWLLAAATLAVDHAAGLSLPVRVDNARPLLGALVGAVLTIAVFTVWMRTVVVGLAAGHVSPRVVAGYLDDGFQRRITEWMVAGFAYLVAVIAWLPTAGPSDDGGARGVPAVSSLLSVVVVVAALVAVLLAIRHAVTSLSLSHVVRRLADQALAVMRHPPAPDDTVPAGAMGTTVCRIRSRMMGWVQHVDHAAILAAIPPGTTVTIHTVAGEFVAVEDVVASVDAELDEAARDRIRDAVAVGDTRDAEVDLAFAIEQLVDVAQHALRPASTDTSTGDEVLVHLRVVLQALVRNGKFTGCSNGEDGRQVISTRLWRPAEHVETAFERLREDAALIPVIRWRIRQVIEDLVVTAEDVGDDTTVEVLRRQLARLDEPRG